MNMMILKSNRVKFRGMPLKRARGGNDNIRPILEIVNTLVTNYDASLRIIIRSLGKLTVRSRP